MSAFCIEGVRSDCNAFLVGNLLAAVGDAIAAQTVRNCDVLALPTGKAVAELDAAIIDWKICRPF